MSMPVGLDLNDDVDRQIAQEDLAAAVAGGLEWFATNYGLVRYFEEHTDELADLILGYANDPSDSNFEDLVVAARIYWDWKGVNTGAEAELVAALEGQTK